MTQCTWCSQPAAGEIETEPAVVRRDARTGAPKEIRPARMLPACAEHKTNVGKGDGPSVQNVRRRKARGVEQPSMFDQAPDGPDNALFDDAA